MSPTTLCTQCTQALDADGSCPACSHRAPPPANLAAKAEALFVSYLAARIVHARQRLKLAQRELANDPRFQDIPGVVETGLFIGLASMVILAGANGIRVVERR